MAQLSASQSVALPRPAAERTGPLRWISPQHLTWVLVAALLTALVVLPLFYIFLESLRTPAGLSFANYTQILGLTRFHEAFRNTMVVGLACAVFGMLLSAPLAWLVSRTTIPWRGFIRLAILGTFVTPGFVNALSWTLLAGPNAGILNKLWMYLTGSSSGFINIFSLQGLIIVSLASVYPLGFLFMYNAFEMMDTEIEEAARVGGAGTFKILWTITLPLTRPAFVAGFILMFLESIILYGAPAVVGVPARVYVVTTQLVSLFEYPPKIGLAAGLSLPLLLITVVMLWLQRKIVGSRTYATVRGKGGRHSRVDLGVWTWPIFALVMLVIVLTFVLPYIVIIGTSLLGQSFRGFSLDNLTLRNFSFVLFSYESGMLSIRNSMITSTLAATIGVLIALVIAYLTQRKLLPFSNLLAFLATAPLVVPGMVFAVGLFAAYSHPPLALYGTLWILALAYLTKFLPFAFMSCVSSIASVYPELESAASVLGASRLRVLRDVTAPLIKGGLLAGWILIFVPAVKELSSSILLYNSETTVIATAIMDAYLLPRWEAVAALSVILLAINAAVFVIGYRLLGGSMVGGGRS